MNDVSTIACLRQNFIYNNVGYGLGAILMLDVFRTAVVIHERAQHKEMSTFLIDVR